jgi:hypothetical protein
MTKRRSKAQKLKFITAVSQVGFIFTGALLLIIQHKFFTLFET